MLTEDQIEALKGLPAGVYLVCAECGGVSEATTIHLRSVGAICGRCARG
jgi:hypothetical protein